MEHGGQRRRSITRGRRGRRGRDPSRALVHRIRYPLPLFPPFPLHLLFLPPTTLPPSLLEQGKRGEEKSGASTAQQRRQDSFFRRPTASAEASRSLWARVRYFLLRVLAATHDHLSPSMRVNMPVPFEWESGIFYSPVTAPHVPPGFSSRAIASLFAGPGLPGCV